MASAISSSADAKTSAVGFRVAGLGRRDVLESWGGGGGGLAGACVLRAVLRLATAVDVRLAWRHGRPDEAFGKSMLVERVVRARGRLGRVDLFDLQR